MITNLQPETDQPTQQPPHQSSSALFAVVGYDGSSPSRAALDTAAEMIRGRSGHLAVVYVSHVPFYATLSAPALVGIQETFPALGAELSAQVREALDDREPRWHFQRRTGSVTHELVAAADELRRRHGPDATIVIIVGASTHLAHHVAGSVAAGLTREHTGFPLLVVPSAPVAATTPPADTSDYFS